MSFIKTHFKKRVERVLQSYSVAHEIFIGKRMQSPRIATKGNTTDKECFQFTRESYGSIH